MYNNNLVTNDDLDNNVKGETIMDSFGNPVEAPKALKFDLGKEIAVNHPDHYKDDQFECIEVMLDTQGLDATQDFCILNAFKYLYRHRKKGGILDLKKADWYLQYAIDLEEKR